MSKIVYFQNKRELVSLGTKYDNILLKIDFDIQGAIKKEVDKEIKEKKTHLSSITLDFPADTIIQGLERYNTTDKQYLETLKNKYGKSLNLISPSYHTLKHYFKTIKNPIELYLKLAYIQEVSFKNLAIIKAIKWKDLDYFDNNRDHYFEQLPKDFEHGVELVVIEHLDYLKNAKIESQHINELTDKYQPKNVKETSNKKPKEHSPTTLRDVIQHKKADEIVELLKRKCKGYKGRKLEILFKVLDESNLINVPRSRFRDLAENTFDWKITSVQSMSNYFSLTDDKGNPNKYQLLKNDLEELFKPYLS